MASWLFACMTTLTGGGAVHIRISGLFMACCEMRRCDDFHRGCVGHSHRNPRDSLHRSCHCSRGGYGILASIRSGWGPRVSGLNRSLGQHHFSSLFNNKGWIPKIMGLGKGDETALSILNVSGVETRELLDSCLTLGGDFCPTSKLMLLF